ARRRRLRSCRAVEQVDADRSDPANTLRDINGEINRRADRPGAASSLPNQFSHRIQPRAPRADADRLCRRSGVGRGDRCRARLARCGAEADSAVVQRRGVAIAQRGHADSGTVASGSVGLGFRRLSLLDVSATGDQPGTTPDGEATIIFGGEIYNLVELRSELEL